MFILEAYLPLVEEWEEKDALMFSAAGRKSDTSEATSKKRTHRWLVVSFQEAQRMKKGLEAIGQVSVVIREKG